MDPISAIVGIGELAIRRLWPDPERQAEEQRKLLEMAQKGDLAQLDAHVKLMLAQVEVNKEEAKSGSTFVAGWRPFCGWVCGFALAISCIPKAIALTLMWAVTAWAAVHGESGAEAITLPEFPDLGVTELIALLGAMLGIGGMRSFDKKMGTQTDRLSREG